MNIKNLAKKLKDDYAALIISETNRLYFTGFSASDGFLIVTNKGAKFITDSRYIEAANQEITECEVELQRAGETYEQIASSLKALGGRKVMIEASRLSVLEAKNLASKLSDFELMTNSDLDILIDELRIKKSEEEKEYIKGAQAIAEEAFNKVLPFIKEGVKEREIAALLDFEMRKLGATAVSFETIVVAGENSSKPHGVPGNNIIKNGDFVTIDFGAIWSGYHSDTTRTVAVGNVTPEMANVYDIVLRAQKAGVATLKAGNLARDADKVCRDIIEKEGFGEYFGHGTGHGVGIEIHEAPNLSPRAKDDSILEIGNVVTIEPGIYLPGKFGVRIEDMLLVEAEGAYNFTTLPKELIVL